MGRYSSPQYSPSASAWRPCTIFLSLDLFDVSRSIHIDRPRALYWRCTDCGRCPVRIGPQEMILAPCDDLSFALHVLKPQDRTMKLLYYSPLRSFKSFQSAQTVIRMCREGEAARVIQRPYQEIKPIAHLVVALSYGD